MGNLRNQNNSKLEIGYVHVLAIFCLFVIAHFSGVDVAGKR